MDKLNNKLKHISLIAVGCALVVIAMGAFTRLTNAGLGCPDWPGCYGHLIVPIGGHIIATIDKMHPSHLFVAHKAWSEMVHRYIAATLGVIILWLLVYVLRIYRQGDKKYVLPSIFLLALLIYQPLLGMWTVTLKLLPVIVTQHLLGGFAILSLLWLISLIAGADSSLLMQESVLPFSMRKWAVIGLILLVLQIFLGAWTSTNYAAITCSSFPFCQMQTWHWDFVNAFNLVHPVGVNYQGGVLSGDARKTIQMVHRLGALIVVMYWVVMIAWLSFQKTKPSKLLRASFIIFSMLIFQVALGISNVLLSRPLLIAVLHNLSAAILLLSVVTFNYYMFFYSSNSTPMLKEEE